MLHLDEVAAWLTGGRSADSTLQEKEDTKLLYEALDQLPDNQRIALTLSKIEGYTNSEIAALLQTTNIAVESLIHRGRKKLSARLEKILKK